ncbi:hypothetical protein Dimus_020347 [Dionaea muscipula]
MLLKLPLSSFQAQAADIDVTRLTKLAAFQERALKHALSFPEVERIVYSTCSIHQIENEDVVKSVLPLASSYGFHLATPFPQWTRRGFPVFDGSEHILRMDPKEDGEGFFIALFVRNNEKAASSTVHKFSSERHPGRHDKPQNHRFQKLRSPFLPTKISNMWSYHPLKKMKGRGKRGSCFPGLRFEVIICFPIPRNMAKHGDKRDDHGEADDVCIFVNYQ